MLSTLLLSFEAFADSLSGRIVVGAKALDKTYNLTLAMRILSWGSLMVAAPCGRERMST